MMYHISNYDYVGTVGQRQYIQGFIDQKTFKGITTFKKEYFVKHNNKEIKVRIYIEGILSLSGDSRSNMQVSNITFLVYFSNNFRLR